MGLQDNSQVQNIQSNNTDGVLKKGIVPIKSEYLVETAMKRSDTQSENITNSNIDMDKPDTCSKKRKRGQNKKRSFNYVDKSEYNLCNRISLGLDLPKNDENEHCKLGHDIEKYLEDLGLQSQNFKKSSYLNCLQDTELSKLTDQCPVFSEFGFCKYGIKCHFRTAHTIILEDKESRNSTENFRQLINTKIIKDLQKLAQYCIEFGRLHCVVSNELLDHLVFGSSNIRDSKILSFRLKKGQYSFKKSSLYLKSKKSVQKVEPELVVINADGSSCSSTIESEVDVFSSDKIGPIDTNYKKRIYWGGKTYLAPLTTVGNLPFRRICKKFGVDITCGEMAMSDSILRGNLAELALLKRHKSEDIFGVQICGKSSESLSKCTEILSNLSTFDAIDSLNCDFVDLNMGCPIDQVFNKGLGSGLMQRTGKMYQCIESMTRTSEIPVTLKFRTGISEKKNIAHNHLSEFKRLGVSLCTMHGRSRQQRYTKRADWAYISECAEISKGLGMPFFGNGDVLSYEEYYNNIDTSGVDGVMIGRGALIKPWIFTEIKERRHIDMSSTERFEMLKDFCNYGLTHWGSDTQGVNKTRRYLLEWQSFLYRYVPVGLLEVLPQKMNDRPPKYRGRDELETLMASDNVKDWIKLSEMILGKAGEEFRFTPKHKSNSYEG